MQRKNEALFAVVLADAMVAMATFFAVCFIITSLQNISDNGEIQLGSICAEISWPNDRDVDIDLWGHSPGDGNVVGFSNMHGRNLNLYRDVLGFNMNPSHIMMEIECSNEIIPGEWTFNVHYYSNHESSPPDLSVPVQMTIRLRSAKSGVRNQTFTGKYVLSKEGEEKTMFDFVIGSDGNLIESSINSRQKPLKAGWNH